jgi:hypothetical protein
VVRGYRATLALIIAVAALLVSLYGNVTLWIVVNNNRGSLCAQREYASTRYNDSVAYLKAHPNGVPALDLSRPALQRSIDAQGKYLATFDDLDCSSDLPRVSRRDPFRPVLRG